MVLHPDADGTSVVSGAFLRVADQPADANTIFASSREWQRLRIYYADRLIALGIVPRSAIILLLSLARNTPAPITRYLLPTTVA